MNRLQLRKLARYQAEAAFLNDNIADFPDSNRSGRLIAEFNAAIGRLTELAALHSSQVLRQSYVIKAESLRKLVVFLGRINRAAVALDHDVPGLAKLFRMPQKRVERLIIASAHSFYNDSEQYESKFMELDLPDTFRDDLFALIESVEGASAMADRDGGLRGGVTGAIVGAIRECASLSRKLQVAVENKYVGNPQKLATWALVSKLEAPAKRSASGAVG